MAEGCPEVHWRHQQLGRDDGRHPRGIAFVPSGSPTYDFYGADRIGANLFGSSIVALDARTGKRLWHFQMVHHDLWDFDHNAAPQLTTIRHDGRNRDVVASPARPAGSMSSIA